MNESVKVSSIEQWDIDRIIRVTREQAGLQEGETVLCLLDGGYAGSWQEVASAETKAETGPATRRGSDANPAE